VGDLVDTVIFTTIAFLGTISTFQFLGLLAIAYISKIVGETLLLPVTYGAVKLCKKVMVSESYGIKNDNMKNDNVKNDDVKNDNSRDSNVIK